MEKQKLVSLQTLRGIAALLVVMFHATKWSMEVFGDPFLFEFFDFGISGVDFFFVLSGFIIFYVHRTDLGQRDQIKPFLVKRFIRIYPFYWSIFFLILPVYFLFPQFGRGFERDFEFIAKSILLWPEGHIIPVAWTLSHEVLFYLLFAVLLAVTGPWRRFILFAWVTGIVIHMVAFESGLIQLKSMFGHLASRFVFNFYNIEFLFGCLAAYCAINYEIRLRKWLMIMGGLLFFFSAYGLNHSVLVPGTPVAVLCFGISFAMIITSFASYNIRTAKNFSRTLSYFGDASYSLYLTHWHLLSLLVKISVKTGLDHAIGTYSVIVLCTLLTLILGCLIYQIIEKPLVTRLRKTL